ncbi:uncharacterized protein M421DRAFT_422827 [Didymella exigua CBS 183.55]|uniref:Uncharacterized protein n=1 Tax=Didymella exigua CBS 183.55 TaxID=1150837 RepID=A0A6A5RJA0_9PLEO|nr:uncharacterized protein M421DRAFT_422827 [Didymella exigua CBS 183.55]KAF1926496.1 hypothetical protein M421DRAFT_422827 [Didymella exigua CBS 183.55]
MGNKAQRGVLLGFIPLRLLMHETEARALTHVDLLCIIGPPGSPIFLEALLEAAWPSENCPSLGGVTKSPHASPEQLTRVQD